MGAQTHTSDALDQELHKPLPSAVIVIDLVIEHSCALRASDIHIDPGENGLQIRIRIDGALHDICKIPLLIYNEIVTRIKILSNLRTDEHAVPQDGRFTITNQNAVQIHLRVSIIPTHHGESIVLRLLVPYANLNSLTSLGFTDSHQQKIQHAISQPHGLILITGPTGSGKSSTLYALLQQLNKRSSSIITIEDPVEYSIEGISQVHARNSGFTFADGLRSVLRQDPDIIGIGEIRDKETATLAIHAALTGHLVLSTLHTNNAESTIPRLLAMGIEPYLLSSTITLIVHQKLVSRLCVRCRKRASLSKDQKTFFERSITQEYLRPRIQYLSSGCDACGRTGYQGRLAIAELLPMTDPKTTADPLWIDALQKANTGLISLESCASILPKYV